jgi:hypothetical protein
LKGEPDGVGKVVRAVGGERLRRLVAGGGVADGEHRSVAVGAVFSEQFDSRVCVLTLFYQACNFVIARDGEASGVGDRVLWDLVL